MTNTLTDEARIRFNCEPQVSGRGRDQRQRREDARREAKRKVVDETVERFRAAMMSDTPPTTEEEACEMALPIVGWLLSMLFSTLARQVIAWLWEKTQLEKGSR
jgi:hypothetical protein